MVLKEFSMGIVFGLMGCSGIGHVFGTNAKRDQCYDNLKVSRNAWDTNLAKVNAKFLSVNLEASGGGAFAVIPLDKLGKLSADLPVFTGHTGAVLDTDFNPYNDCRALILIWNFVVGWDPGI
jgi:hypothetical protein